MKHDPRLANDLVLQSLLLKITKLEARVATLEAIKTTPLKKAVRHKRPTEPRALAAYNAMLPRIKAVAEAHRLDLVHLLGPDRRRFIVDARAEAAFVCHCKGFSSTDIGLALGGRDHTTALALIRRHERLGGAK